MPKAIPRKAISYELEGRTAQKARTREAIVAAAVGLIERGDAATVDAAAAAAGVGRGTAYRYFPSQRALLAAAYPRATAGSMLPVPPPDDVAERVKVVVGEITRMTRATEPALRTMLRLSLDDRARSRELPLRKGRRLVWVTEALAPLDATVDPRRLGALALAIAATCGIEVHVWLTDIAGLDADGAGDVVGWIAESLLAGALGADAPDPPSTAAALAAVLGRLPPAPG